MAFGFAGRRWGGVSGGALLAAFSLACVGCSGPGGQFVEASNVEQFDAMVVRSPKPVLVEFYRTTCMACTFSNPAMTSLSEDYADKAGFVKVERNTLDVRARYNILGYPTIILFLGGREYDRWVGANSIDAMRPAIDRAAAELKVGLPKPIASGGR